MFPCGVWTPLVYPVVPYSTLELPPARSGGPHDARRSRMNSGVVDGSTTVVSICANVRRAAARPRLPGRFRKLPEASESFRRCSASGGIALPLCYCRVGRAHSVAWHWSVAAPTWSSRPAYATASPALPPDDETSTWWPHDPLARERARAYGCVCVCACEVACVHVCVRAGVCACPVCVGGEAWLHGKGSNETRMSGPDRP